MRVSIGHKNPQWCNTGGFLFRLGWVAQAQGWLPTILLHPAICKCNRRLYLPQQREKMMRIYPQSTPPSSTWCGGGSMFSIPCAALQHNPSFSLKNRLIQTVFFYSKMQNTKEKSLCDRFRAAMFSIFPIPMPLALSSGVIGRPSLCLMTQGQPIFLYAANRFYRQGPAQSYRFCTGPCGSMIQVNRKKLVTWQERYDIIKK